MSSPRQKFKADQKYAKKTLEGEIEKWRKVRSPPYKVEVSKNGKIDGACDGKNEWDNALRELAPWHYH